MTLIPDIWFGCDELHSHKLNDLSSYIGPFSSTNTPKSFPPELLSIHSPSSLYLDWDCSQVCLMYLQGITNPMDFVYICPYISCSRYFQKFCLFLYKPTCPSYCFSLVKYSPSYVSKKPFRWKHLSCWNIFINKWEVIWYQYLVNKYNLATPKCFFPIFVMVFSWRALSANNLFFYCS